MSPLPRPFTIGGKYAWGLLGGVALALAATAVLAADTAAVRFRRDVTRMVFNDNLELLEDVRLRVGASSDTLHRVLAANPEDPEPPGDRAYLVVSIEDHRVWYKVGNRTLFTTGVATGSGKVLAKDRSGGSHWKFETPRGRLVVQSKESDPVWVPPDWHYVEAARKRGLGLVRLNRGESVATPDGGSVVVQGNDVVIRHSDGRAEPFEVADGREIVVAGRMLVPPFGTNQRKYPGVLGSHRLNLGDGYALHGTDKPETIGRSVSHGCVRLRNEDIETLYRLVPVGTPVYIY
jgi:hypothetical protein